MRLVSLIAGLLLVRSGTDKAAVHVVDIHVAGVLFQKGHIHVHTATLLCLLLILLTDLGDAPCIE